MSPASSRLSCPALLRSSDPPMQKFAPRWAFSLAPRAWVCLFSAPVVSEETITFIQQLINGLSLGATYALVALGYTMVYGVLRFINFAHGDIFMLGAFIGLFSAPKLLP